MDRTISLAVTLGVALSLSEPCAAQLAVGTPAKPLEFVAAVNHPAIAHGAFSNLARVYCFVRLKEDDSLFYLETFDKLIEEFALEPVLFFAITNEAKEEVESTVAKEEVPTPILIAAGDGGQKDYEFFKFPTVVVIDGANKIRFYGMPGEYDAIRDAITDSAPSSLAVPDLPPAAKAIGKHFEKHQYGEAGKALAKELAKPKLADADRAKLTDAKARAEAIALKLRASSARAEKAEDWVRLVVTLRRLEKDCQGLDAAADAKARLEALAGRAKGDPAFARELAGAEECAKVDRLERDRDWKKAQAAYASISKLHADTKAGKFAAARADALKTRTK